MAQTVRSDILLTHLLHILLRCFCKLGSICIVNLSNVRHERVIGVRILEQGGDGYEHLNDLGGWFPYVCLEQADADRAILVNVRMVDARNELDRGRLERVVGREDNVNIKSATFVSAFRLGGRMWRGGLEWKSKGEKYCVGTNGAGL